jgi:hypothetical protein
MGPSRGGAPSGSSPNPEGPGAVAEPQRQGDLRAARVA